MKKNKQIEAGDWVAYTDRLAHRAMPRYYPMPGTVGQVMTVMEDVAWVQWPEGSTSGSDYWAVTPDKLVPAPGPADVRRLQVLAAVFCFAALVLGIHVFQELLLRQWVETACCFVGAAAAMLKGMELDRRSRAVPARPKEEDEGDGTV